jgi:DNA invertase Pin-like site-specific DNA recombinase
MNNISIATTKISTIHLSKIAYVYLRQSSFGQLKQNQESTSLQYQLANRAILLGWPQERVQIIDEDLGKSGKFTEDRSGFQYLIAEIGLGKAGLVISLDSSRLARNNTDWYQLLELCSLFGVLIADAERLYDPRCYHDRLLLGLSGMMSEAELHHLKMRLQTGALNKAARGELRVPLPAGLSYTHNGEVVLNPDQEVQERLRLVFEKFRQLGSAKAVMRYFKQMQLSLPIRPILGPSPHEIIWQSANSFIVLQILKNPGYAGAYTYGRVTTDPTRRKPGHKRSGQHKLPLEQWPICLLDAHPSYISWEEFIANQMKLKNNLNNYKAGRPGVRREGAALLQGIVFCGLCSMRMSLHYTGLKGEYPVYTCFADKKREARPPCQDVRAQQVDCEIERIVLAALAPDRIALSLAALAELEQETKLLQRQWELKRERANYEAERARRQYNAVEPENRLVARSLEKLWEEKLRSAEAIEQEYKQWQKDNNNVLTQANRDEIIALGEDLPKLWYVPSTTSADRKQIIRLVIKEVILDRKSVEGWVQIKINWQTGASSEHWIKRRVNGYKNYIDSEELQRRIRELNAEKKMDAEIAAQLNKEGFLSSQGKSFSGQLIQLLRKKWGILTIKINGVNFNPLRWPDGTYSVAGAAQVLGVDKSTVFSWLKRGGLLKGNQLTKRMPWKISLSEEQISELKSRSHCIGRPKKEAL